MIREPPPLLLRSLAILAGLGIAWAVVLAELGTCKVEGLRVPAGTRMCMKQYVMVCSAHGTWQNTGEAC